MLYLPPRLVQTAYAEVTSNVSTTSATYVDLAPLTLTLSTIGNTSLEVHYSACVEAVFAVPNIDFQLLVGGSVVMGATGNILSFGNPGYTSCPSMRYKSGTLSAGSYIVKIQWRTSTGTAQIRPANFIYGYGGLLVREVAV